MLVWFTDLVFNIAELRQKTYYTDLIHQACNGVDENVAMATIIQECPAPLLDQSTLFLAQAASLS